MPPVLTGGAFAFIQQLGQAPYDTCMDHHEHLRIGELACSQAGSPRHTGHRLEAYATGCNETKYRDVLDTVGRVQQIL